MGDELAFCEMVSCLLVFVASCLNFEMLICDGWMDGWMDGWDVKDGLRM